MFSRDQIICKYDDFSVQPRPFGGGRAEKAAAEKGAVFDIFPEEEGEAAQEPDRTHPPATLRYGRRRAPASLPGMLIFSGLQCNPVSRVCSNELVSLDVIVKEAEFGLCSA